MMQTMRPPPIIFALAALALGVLAGCSSESSPQERTNVGPSANDGGADADATADAKTPDPNEGRDEDPASCFAACQNTAFSCTGSLNASLTPDSAGCSGTITAGTNTSTLKLDCVAKQVCVDGACVSGTFSAFSFAYTPAGGAKTVCTRE